MSAYIVHKKHIDALISFMVSRQISVYLPSTGEDIKADGNQDRIGQILWDANHQNVSQRYNENNEAPVYKYEVYPRPLSPVEALKACAGYSYQCSDMREYDESVANQIIESIKYKAINGLPGYDEAEWAIDE